jgi:hypothetical protein
MVCSVRFRGREFGCFLDHDVCIGSHPEGADSRAARCGPFSHS